jgi:NDP-sugar pyrophosphorylase family protein
MRAVVLAAGLGMRLRPFTTILPKPLLPIGDRPILEIILGQLAACGFSKADLCVGHLGNLIRVHFSERTRLRRASSSTCTGSPTSRSGRRERCASCPAWKARSWR